MKSGKIVDLLKVRWLRRQGLGLTEWETTFLKDIRCKLLSIKQKQKIDEMYAKYRHGERDYFVSPTINEYSEIHDFN